MDRVIPDYAFAPLHRGMNSIFKMGQLLDFSLQGLSTISRRPAMAQRIMDLTLQAGKTITPDLEANLEKAKKDAEFTDKERDEGFPFLHAYTLVGEWGALEAAIEDMLIGILANEPSMLEKDEFAKIKIPLTKFEQLDKDERMSFLLGEVQRAQSSGLAQGVNAFENVLKVFDLSGPVEEYVRTGIWEVNHMRNVIVHRNHRADLRFVEACPSMNLKVGDRVIIRHDRYEYYTCVILDYILLLFRRLGVRFDAPPPKWALPNALPPIPAKPASEAST